MSTLTLRYTVSNAFLRQQAAATGNSGPKNRSIDIDLTTLDPAARAAALAVANVNANSQGVRFDLEIGRICTLRDKALWEETASAWRDETSLEFDHEPTLDELVAIAAANKTVRETSEQRAKAAQAAKAAEEKAKRVAEEQHSQTQAPLYNHYAPLIAAAPDLQTLRAIALPPECDRTWSPNKGPNLSQLIIQRTTELEKTLSDAIKAAWIDAYGSPHLRRACAAGHNCDRLYCVERAAFEYPGAVLDYERTADWKDRSCPSLRLLDQRDAILTAHPASTAKIVWLTTAPSDRKPSDDQYDYEPFDPCEAIVIDDPIYRHWLILYS